MTSSAAASSRKTKVEPTHTKAVPRPRSRTTATPVRPARPRTAGLNTQKGETNRLLKKVHRLRQSLREYRRAAETWQAEARRVPILEAEIAELRREIGPQRSLFQALPVVHGSRRRWLPPVVETHLTALNDQDVQHAAALFAANGIAIDGAAAQPPTQGENAVRSFHESLFATWADFRFFPHAWHDVESAAFLEGNASFLVRRAWRGVDIPEGTRPVNLDMLLVYDLVADGEAERIARFKMFYDAATLLAQLSKSPAQGSLF